MKLRRVFLVGLFISFMSVGTASAGMFDIITGGGGGGGDLDTFLVRAKTSEALINASTKALFDATASKEDQAKAEEMQKKMNEENNPKEKNKIQRELTSTQLAIVEQKAKDQELQKEAATWDTKKKGHVANAFFNYALGALQAGLIVKDGQALVTNPMNAVKAATKLGEVKDALASLGGIATGSVGTISALKTLMSAADISVKIPTNATEKPKVIEGGL